MCVSGTPARLALLKGFAQLCPGHANGDCLLKEIVGVVYKTPMFCLKQTNVSTSVTYDSDN